MVEMGEGRRCAGLTSGLRARWTLWMKGEKMAS